MLMDGLPPVIYPPAVPFSAYPLFWFMAQIFVSPPGKSFVHKEISCLFVWVQEAVIYRRYSVLMCMRSSFVGIDDITEANGRFSW